MDEKLVDSAINWLYGEKIRKNSELNLKFFFSPFPLWKKKCGLLPMLI